MYLPGNLDKGDEQNKQDKNASLLFTNANKLGCPVG